MTSFRPLEHRIRALLLDRMAIDVPAPDTDLLGAGYIDSLTLTELLSHLESDLSCRLGIEDLDIERLRTIRGLARMVAAKGVGPAEGEELDGHPSSA